MAINVTGDIVNEIKFLEEKNSRYTNELLPLVSGLLLLMVIGTVGNSLVVYVYQRKKQGCAKRSFILTLAILDLIVCVIVIPFEIYDVLNQVTFTVSGLCKSMRVLEYVTVLSAGFVLVAVSFERYYFLCKAFKEFTPKKATLICVVCVTCATLLSLPAGLFASSKERNIVYDNFSLTGHECSMNSENESLNSPKTRLKRVYYYSLAFVFLSCFTMFVILYTLIGRLLWTYQNGSLVKTIMPKRTDRNRDQRTKKVSEDRGSNQSSRSGAVNDTQIHGRRSVKSIRSIVIFFSVTVVFVISFLPHIVVRILGFLQIKIDSTLLYNCLIRSFLFSNVSNPFIYSIFNSMFRKELKKTFRRMNKAVLPRRWTNRRKSDQTNMRQQPSVKNIQKVLC